MTATIAGWVWVEGLSGVQRANLRDRLTVRPRKTTDIAAAKTPEPILLYREEGERFAVPRGFWQQMNSGRHAEITAVSYGQPMQPLRSTWRAEGPYAEQGEIVDALYHRIAGGAWGGGLLEAGCGTGKALANHEPVLTDHGFVPISELFVGERVAGTDGKFYDVLGVYPQGERDLYRITFTDRTSVDCDADHLWTFDLRREKGKRVTIKTRDLLGQPLRISPGRRFWLPWVAPVVFPRQDLPIDPYMMGVFLGNGSTRSGSVVIHMSAQDASMASELVLPGGSSIHISFDPKRKGVVNFGFVRRFRSLAESRKNGLMKDILTELGLFGCGSHEKFIPRVYLLSSIEQRIALLQGLADTDRSAMPSGHVEYSTVSEKLAEDVRFVVSTLGGTSVCMKRKTRYTKKDGSVSRWFESYRICYRLPSAMVPFRSMRKKTVFERAVFQRRGGRAVESIERIGKGGATCISVNSPDKLFLTRNCIPTHNTVCGIELARRIGRTAIVLVHKEFLLKQWTKRINQQLPSARVGIIQQDRCEWENVDFTIALMQSLIRDDGQGSKYDPRMYDAFALVIPDEAHHVPSEQFSQIIPRFSAAYLCGLSATFRRKDGAENVFFYQLGPVVYTAKTQSMVPKLRVLKTAARLHDIRRGRYQVDKDKLNSAQITTQLADDAARQRLVVDHVLRAVRGGRKVLVVSERLEHLRDMARAVAAAVPALGVPWAVTQDFYTGQWFTGQLWGKGESKRHSRGEPKFSDRSDAELDAAETAQVIYATRQMVDEACDIPALDVLVLATPVSDAEQVVGRVRRWCAPEVVKCVRLCAWRAGQCAGKPDPVVIDVVDPLVAQVAGKWRKRQRLYREMGVKMEGIA